MKTTNFLGIVGSHDTLEKIIKYIQMETDIAPLMYHKYLIK